jgi:hypothetical protein
MCQGAQLRPACPWLNLSCRNRESKDLLSSAGLWDNFICIEEAIFVVVMENRVGDQSQER